MRCLVNSDSQKVIWYEHTTHTHIPCTPTTQAVYKRNE